MNKGQQFWLDSWRERRIPFHKTEVNADLIEFWPKLECSSAATVLIPLCGKSLDIMWLASQELKVVGIELSEEAVLQFASENQLELKKTSVADAILYSNAFIELWVADIFSLKTSLLPTVDAIYDRGALIALPEELRSMYVTKCLQWLKSNGRILLKTMAYTAKEFAGPPFNVSHEEVYRLFNETCEVNCVKHTHRNEDKSDHVFAQGGREIWDTGWIITKK